MCSDIRRNERENHEGCGFCLLILALICLMVIIILSVTMTPLLGIQSETCRITNVTYPTQLPTNENYLNENFISCDCGKRCISDAGYCIRVYAEYNNQTFLLNNKLTTRLPDTLCTIAETHCIDGESIIDRIESLVEAAELAAPYETMAANSETVPCYIYGSNIFLEGQNDTDYIIAVSITGAFMIAFVIGTIYCCRK